MEKKDTARALHDELDAFLEDESGVPFHTLAQFAEPLFKLYQVDLRASLQKEPEKREADELAALLAVLETARLLWAFFGLTETTRQRKVKDLQHSLLGPDPGEEEKLDFLDLLSVMQEQWNSVATEEDVASSSEETFDRLLAEYRPRSPQSSAQSASRQYGPDNLNPEEARALFARPLLEDPDVLENPERMEEAMDRADEYWNLAHASPAKRAHRIETLKERWADSPQEAEAVEAEAQQMIERFAELFPDHAP